jgi:hypothetical protein
VAGGRLSQASEEDEEDEDDDDDDDGEGDSTDDETQAGCEGLPLPPPPHLRVGAVMMMNRVGLPSAPNGGARTVGDGGEELEGAEEEEEEEEEEDDDDVRYVLSAGGAWGAFTQAVALPVCHASRREGEMIALMIRRGAGVVSQLGLVFTHGGVCVVCVQVPGVSRAGVGADRARPGLRLRAGALHQVRRGRG